MKFFENFESFENFKKYQEERGQSGGQNSEYQHSNLTNGFLNVYLLGKVLQKILKVNHFNKNTLSKSITYLQVNLRLNKEKSAKDLYYRLLIIKHSFK